MGTVFLRPLILSFFMVSLYSFNVKSKAYSYTDGNNNTYLIRSTSLEYKPISKENSSSGTYSGGEAKKITITKEQFSKIESLIDSIRKDKKNIIDSRPMGCGTLAVNDGKPIYIALGSTNKNALEKELTALLGN